MPTPATPINTPATAGPTIRAALNMDELSAIAFMRSSLPTSSTMNAWRAGMSNALTTPKNTASTMTCHVVTLAGPHEHGQRQRLEHLQSLCPHDEATLVHAIHDDTRVQREQQHAQGAERLRQPDGERRVGDVEHQPAERDRLHPGPDERDALTEEEEPEVAVGKRSEAKRARGGGFVHCGKARRRPIFRVGSPMKYTTYSRYLPELADTVNLQALLAQLADFLLQSGFARGAYSHPFWGEC